MRILFLSQRFLLPMDTGGKIRTGNILRNLNNGHFITLVSNVDPRKDNPYLREISHYCSEFIKIERKEIERYSARFYLRLIVQMFSINPISVLNDTSKALAQAVESRLKESKYDIAVCDFVQSALMFRRLTGVPTILFQHNVESVIAQRHFSKASNAISQIFWWLQWKKMVRFEKMACGWFTRIIAVSEQDRENLKRLYNLDRVDTIATGVDIDYFKPMSEIEKKPGLLVFCGSMDWLPNEDAMLFFIRKILPEVKDAVGSVSLTIVGRNPSPRLKRIVTFHPEVRLTGWVDDIRPYIAEASVVIAPIRIGGGTRIKIYEAMAMGKPVVSTRVGAEGLSVTNTVDIFLEDEPIRFAERIVNLMHDRYLQASIGEAAMTFVRRYCSSKIVAKAFERICEAEASHC